MTGQPALPAPSGLRAGRTPRVAASAAPLVLWQYSAGLPEIVNDRLQSGSLLPAYSLSRIAADSRRRFVGAWEDRAAQLERCRRLAREIGDVRTKAILESWVAELEQQLAAAADTSATPRPQASASNWSRSSS